MKLERLGPYKLERILGRGGMGAVYVGLNFETGERAAVKVLNPGLSDDAGFRERFKSEVETLKKLLHPNIVQLFGFGEQDDVLFYVMELVEGRSLQDELLSGRRFQWREVVRIGIDVARALKHAHDRGVIHRDLKPANLLIDSHDHIKLTDFGIAKLYGGTSLTAEGGVLGTADYMSPEQAEGKAVTARCDLYSLGSVLYALLTGRPPFAGRSLPEVLQGLRFENPVPLRRLNPDVPDEFDSIITQLLQKDPQQRIPTAMALANRLRAMEHALSIDTRIDLGRDEIAAEDPEKKPLLGATSSLNLPTSLGSSSRPTMPMPAARNTNQQPAAENSEGSASAPPTERTRGDADLQGRQANFDPHGEGERGSVATAAGRAVFTAVSEEELRAKGRPADGEENSVTGWVKTIGLAAAVLILAGAFYYYATRPPNADALYQRIKGAEEAGIEQLADVEGELVRFLATFPDDPRAQELKELEQDVKLYRLQRRFEIIARRGSGGSLSALEQAYVAAIRQSETEPQVALAKLQTLVEVYEGSQQLGQSKQEQRAGEQCLELARQQVSRLRRFVAAKTKAEQKLLADRMAEADELALRDPAAARRVWQGVVNMYEEEDWAGELVQQARSRLDEHPKD